VVSRATGKAAGPVRLLKEDGGSFTGHAGGLSVWGDWVYIAGSRDACVYVYSREAILAAQAEGRIHGTWVKALDPTRVKDEVVMGDYKIQFELVSSGRRNGGAPQRTGGTYAPDAQGYAIVIQDSADCFTFLGSNIRVVFQPREGSKTVGLAKVTTGDYTPEGKWVEGRWLNGDEIQLRYDIIPAIEENYSGQGLDFGRPSPEFMKVQLYQY
jgi:hypothetical protein